MKGRKPTPTHLKVLAGNPGHRPINAAEPVPPGELFAPPDWLTPKQKDAWRYAIDHAPSGLLRKLDSALLAIWIIAEDMHREAAEKVAKSGMVVRAPSGTPIQNPYLSIKNRQAEIMLRTASELGFSPTSRGRANYGGEASQKENRFANNAARRNQRA